MLWEVWRYFDHDWIYALGALAICMMLGFLYRFSAILFFLGFTYTFLLEQARYLNHFYLVCLISFLLIFVSPHRAFAIDALIRPKLRSETLPAWMLWLLRIQIGIPYFYGGLAKLNGDWLRGEPMRMWLSERTDFPIIGEFFTEEWMVYLMSYGGLLLDLLVVPFLLWRRTRVLAFCFAGLFHLMNVKLFSIGIFPWLMIAATAIFFPPDWPRRFINLVRRAAKIERPEIDEKVSLPRYPHWIMALLSIYLAVQLLVPLRHHLYPGKVHWTEEGHNFSWNMKLRDKSARAQFFVTDSESQRTWQINLRRYLIRRQISKMSTRPDLILEFSHYLANEFRSQGYEQIEVRARVSASLNGRKRQPLIDSKANLAAISRNILAASWILPLKEPLP